jgi:glycogen(starch) synthase
MNDYLGNNNNGTTDDDDEADRIPIPMKAFPALHSKDMSTTQKDELLREGDIKTLNKMTLVDKKEIQY